MEMPQEGTEQFFVWQQWLENRTEEEKAQAARITALEAENAKLKAALKPFADSYERMRLYSETEPAEVAPLMADEHNVLFELLHDNEDKSVNVGNLRNAAAALKDEPTNAELDLIAPF